MWQKSFANFLCQTICLKTFLTAGATVNSGKTSTKINVTKTTNTRRNVTITTNANRTSSSTTDRRRNTTRTTDRRRNVNGRDVAWQKEKCRQGVIDEALRRVNCHRASAGRCRCSGGFLFWREKTIWRFERWQRHKHHCWTKLYKLELRYLSFIY